MNKRYKSYRCQSVEEFFEKVWIYIKLTFRSREILREARDYKTEIKVMNAKRYFTIPRGWKEKARVCVAKLYKSYIGVAYE
jgi:hypothetical protein